MVQAVIEHVNITVGNPERTAEMLNRLFGWTVRWTGPAAMGGRTIHVGTDKQYVALYTDEGDGGKAQPHSKGQPLNHIAIEVDNLDDVETRALACGLVPFSHGDYDPGRRFYLLDADGIEWEIVSYVQP